MKVLVAGYDQEQTRRVSEALRQGGHQVLGAVGRHGARTFVKVVTPDVVMVPAGDEGRQVRGWLDGLADDLAWVELAPGQDAAGALPVLDEPTARPEGGGGGAVEPGAGTDGRDSGPSLDEAQGARGDELGLAAPLDDQPPTDRTRRYGARVRPSVVGAAARELRSGALEGSQALRTSAPEALSSSAPRATAIGAASGSAEASWRGEPRPDELPPVEPSPSGSDLEGAPRSGSRIRAGELAASVIPRAGLTEASRASASRGPIGRELSLGLAGAEAPGARASSAPPAASPPADEELLDKLAQARFGDYHSLLELEPDASPYLVREQYKRLDRLYSFKGWPRKLGPEELEILQEIQSAIRDAYLILGDPELRARYERALLGISGARR